MKRVLPHPLLICGLVLMWLILTRFSLGNLILGLAIATLASWVVARLRPRRVRVRRPLAVLRLFVRVTSDIFMSNMQVAGHILRGRAAQRHPGFIQIDLRLRDRNGLALLAIIISSTPGTAWIEHDPESRHLLMHILDLKEGANWQSIIRDRYETLLMEIFE